MNYPLCSILITLFTMIVVVNAYNLIDGVDGLSGGIGVIASLFLGLIFALPLRNGDAIGSCGPWGSYFIISTLPVFLWGIRELDYRIFVSCSSHPICSLVNLAFVEVFGSVSSVMPVAILMIPLYDTLRVFIH